MMLKRYFTKKKIYNDPIKEKISQMVIHKLMGLPAYRLENKSRKIFEDYEYSRLYREIARTVTTRHADFNIYQEEVSTHKSLSNLYKNPNIWQKTWFYFISLSNTDKRLLCISAISLIVASIVKILFNSNNPWFLLIIVLSILVFQLFSLIFSLRLYLWQVNIDSTFFAIKRNLDKVYRYTDDLGEIDEEKIQEKADMISENLIEEEIYDLDYRLKKVNFFSIIFAFSIVLCSVYIAGDAYVPFIQFLAKTLKLDNFDIIKSLTTERFALFVLFPIGLALSKDIVILALQERNQKLRRSLAILRDQRNEH